ncbi:MAG TPA: aminotransferase class I/II-fold pyridoxal phosphate-dependent enzyme [Bacteroidota bacterium]
MEPSALITLDRNENLYGPAPACFEVLRSISLNELSVYSRDYTRGVKSRLSERLAKDLGVSESQLLLGEGSEDLLKQAVHCYLGPGEKILCPAQSWWYYQTLASEVGGETITYALQEGPNAYFFDVDQIIALYRKESPRVVLIASPNNPTGNSFPDEQINKLVEAFRESIVILDEAYWGFADVPNGRIARFAEEYRNLIVLRTFSKYYALAGTRIGFAAVGKSLGRLTKFAARYLGYNRISESLALAALDSERYYQSIRQRMAEDRERYYRYFDARQGFKCFRSNANFILVRLPSGSANVLRKFLKDRGIQIKFFDEPEFENCVRITIGTEEQNRTLLGALSDFKFP